MEGTHEYDDIIGLPHHVSDERAHMPLIERGAQFAPFAALTGYADAIAEEARPTEEKAEPDEERKQAIGRCLAKLSGRAGARPLVTLTWFVPDARKAGGRYVTKTAAVRKVEELTQTLHLTDGTAVPFDDIAALEESPAAAE